VPARAVGNQWTRPDASSNARTMLWVWSSTASLRRMVRAFDDASGRVHWFPTARTGTTARYEGRFAGGHEATLRCLYVGHVREAKGVLTAIQAIQEVPNTTLDIHGPLIDLAPERLQGAGVRYCGALPPDQVTEVMARYDLLLFPTRYPGEGYPGTLVEASMVGLPMVLSRWQSLPEMFSDREACFIEPNSTQDLVAALRRVHERPSDLIERSEALRRRAADYDADAVFGGFLDICRKAAASRRGPRAGRQHTGA
jgi:hypothetical protein